MGAGLLEGKRGVVMGVANERSIAWGCAKACAAEGASIVFSYPGEALERRVRKLAEEVPGSAVFPCDVRDDAQIKDFFAQVRELWGSIDFVIHSIAFAEREDLTGHFVNTSRANFLLAIDVSAYSFVAVAREARDLMPNGGSLVAMTYYGGEKVIPRYNVMGVAKATLDMSMRYLAADLGPNNIRVNCLSPGPIRTLSASAIGGFKNMHDVAQEAAPLRRLALPDDVGQAAVFLLSDRSSCITGEIMHVDGGCNVLGMSAANEPKSE